MSAAEREPRQGGDVSHADPIAELRPSLADTADAAGADETGITVRIHPDDAAASDLENSRSVVVHEENVYAASAHTDTPIAPSPSVVGSSSSTLPAAPSSSSATATEPSWLASLRADWDTDAIELASQKRVREARNRPAGGRVLLSPAVEAMPPLQGDVVWKREPYRRITVDQYETYLEASKLKQYRFHRMIRQITSMFKPVVLLCVLIFIYSQLVVKNEKNPKYAWKMLVYKQQPEDSTAHKFTGSLSNALTVLSAILLITFTFIFLYWMEWKLALRRFLIAVITVLLLPWIYFGLQVIEYYDARVDSISYALACLQFLACGYFALVVKAETPANINRFYLVALAVSVAWPFMEFTEWTVWTTIIVLTLYGQYQHLKSS
jgi:hypothetical protein